MNILLNEISGENSDLADFLIKQPNISIYLSVSHNDTVRIINDIKPEVVIFPISFTVENSFVKGICDRYPELAIYIFDKDMAKLSLPELIDCRNYKHIQLDAIINN